MTKLPSYFLIRPSTSTDPETLRAFDAIFESEVVAAGGRMVEYALPVPLWQFLCWLVDAKNVVLHGSGNPEIAEFEPRKSSDVSEFGNRKAVYAASDGIWPIYFAILDRQRQPMTLVNGSFRVEDGEGRITDPFYFFSITRAALERNPFQAGMIYILPRDTFERQPELMYQGVRLHIPQWASLHPVTPLARIPVTPEDFPFLSQIRGHDDRELSERAVANPDGFPWLDDSEA